MLSIGFILGYVNHGRIIERQRANLEPFQAGFIGHGIDIQGVVVDIGKHGEGPYILRVIKSESLPVGSRVLVSGSKYFDMTWSYGDIIHGSGELAQVRRLRNPHGFDQARWFHRQGVDLAFSLRNQPTLLGVSRFRWPVRIMTMWRHHIRQAVTVGLEPGSKQSGLICAVVLGERPPRTSEMIQYFQESGTLHVFAVSGLHVGMVGVIVAGVLWFFRMPRWLTISGVIFCMFMYAGITGMHAPAVRAAIMATIFLLGFLLQRRPSLLNSLAASAILVLLFDSHQLFTPGFQLSYGVLLAIGLFAGFWVWVMKPLGEIDAFMPRSLLSLRQEFLLERRKWLRGALSVSTAAWMGSAPLMWLHFGIVTPIAIVAGIPLVLLVFLILAVAMFSLLAGSIWQPAGEAVNILNAHIATATYSTAALFSKMPGGHYYHEIHDASKYQVIVFDVPYGGGAHFLDMGGGILLDCGRSAGFRYDVMPTLTALRKRPDSLIVSHADSKHSGAMLHCLEFFDPKQALIPQESARSRTYKQFLLRAKERECALIVPRGGQVFEIEPDVMLEVLHAPTELDGMGRADDMGLVLRLHCCGWRILFTGDAGYLTEERMLKSGVDLRSDIIVMGRNRHDFTGSWAFLEAVQPKAIISTNAPFPRREVIPEDWRRHLEKSSIVLFDQLQSGAVTIEMNDGELTLTPMLLEVSPLTLNRN